MAAEHVDAKLKLVERRRRSLGSDVAVEHNAIVAGDASDYIEQVEDVGEGDHCISFEAHKGLANEKCLETVDALPKLWRTNGQALNVCL